MSDGWSDYMRDHNKRVLDQFLDSARYESRPAFDRPIVPRITEYGRMMWADDLGLPSNNTPPFFWLGRDAEATNG